MQQPMSGLLVSITAILTAFAVLSGIALVVYLLRFFSIPRAASLRPPAAAEPGRPAPVAPAFYVPPPLPEEGSAGIPPRVVAAITAALSVYLDRPATWTPRATPAAAGSWVALGRQAQLRSRRVGTR